VGANQGGNFAYDYSLDELTQVLSAVFGTEAAAKLTAELPKNMAVFHFPYGERDNVLLHTAFFHEIGHQLDLAILGISNRVVSEYLSKKDNELRESLGKALEPVLRDTFGGVERAQHSLDDENAALIREELTKQVQLVLWTWSREFCADLIATRILGPAYALVIVTSPTLLDNLTVHAPSHPATLMRLRKILELLSNPDAGDFLGTCGHALTTAGIGKLLEEWKARCAAADYGALKWQPRLPLASKDIPSLAVRFADELANQILAEVIRATAESAYQPEDYRADVANLLPKLESGITINEQINHAARTHTPSGIASVLNVGWACFLKDNSVAGRARLSGLIRKSVETSHIQRALL
jgi:hypothetical protein